MSKENIIQGIISVVVAGVSAYLQVIAIPVVVLVLVMILDYITGMMSAYANNNLSSRIGILGILKKIGYLSTVCVGVCVDYILFSGVIGLTMDSKIFFGLIITVWLIINELISILENIAKMGISLPKFITKIVDRLKSTIEDKVE